MTLSTRSSYLLKKETGETIMFSVKWVVNTFITVFITMVFIYIIKKVSAKYQIPVISTIAEEV